ncbi:hypothetical protein A9K97_gp307 [Tokyovirus A1]|uniref:hypothetical protein n=1 Tax=Tokyovirus A1 TaxID=1826170 RepID=UPI0007A9676B|nr:hypothetical protein A9K97_gp307 [Tokyovirus A1]BAU80044.1 hypothetical protein [Tokyovirus A1]
MHRFLGKRELVSFCACDAPENLPRKEDYVTVKTRMNVDVRTSHVLPDGSIHFLEIKYGTTVVKFIKNMARNFTLRTTQEFKAGVPHGKYKVFRTDKNGKEELQVEGTFRKGKAHGNFFIRGVENAIEHTCTFVKGRVLEFSEAEGRHAIISRNKKSGTLHYFEKDGELCLPLKVSRYLFSEFKREWPSYSHLLFDTISQKFKTYEYRTQLVFPSFVDTQETKFSNIPGHDNFKPNEVRATNYFVWVGCPYKESLREEEHPTNPPTILFV